ncbi:MAG TPA: SusD/RagB family nutrient-binding outer membrane lipoprotein, partial [Gemmatimonadaceae bacterium]|nr:SusD/RagB family nutrient-binding outer membrane lipoprotein [Gemmatimonadaceae bacterium]
MSIKNKLAAFAMLGAALGATACQGDFLTGGELSNDPNRPTVASNDQLFVGTQETLWAYWGSDPARVTGVYAQQFTGLANQYGALGATYSQDATTTNGTHAALYTGGGLVDIVKLQKGTAAANDSVYLGIARIMEGALMGTGADLFGDLVYKEALAGKPNPTLDDQLSVYDSVQTVLSAGITDLAATGPTNIGPGAADLVYGGDATKWTAMAHTLKARFFMHTAEKNGTAAYQAALAQAKLGIASDAGNYFGAFTTANQPAEANFYYQFHGPAGRGGDLGGGVFLDSLLKARHDPRDTTYFSHTKTGAVNWLSATRGAPDFQQPFVTFDENTLIWAEAAYRTGDVATALVKLNQERANHGLPAEVVSGQALLNEILLEKYIADFQLGEEAWNDYKRTCTPNIAPPQPGLVVPGRMFYDSGEENTNTNVPA